MAEKYKAPFWLNQLLIGTAHPAMMLLMEYYDAERARERRAMLDKADRVIFEDLAFAEAVDGNPRI